MVLHEGQIADIKLAEAKLWSPPLSYLNALTDEGFAKAEQMLVVADLLNPKPLVSRHHQVLPRPRI